MCVTSLLVVLAFYPLGACVLGWPGGIMGDGCVEVVCGGWGVWWCAFFTPFTDILQSSFKVSQYFVVLIAARRGKCVHEVLVVLLTQPPS